MLFQQDCKVKTSLLCSTWTQSPPSSPPRFLPSPRSCSETFPLSLKWFDLQVRQPETGGSINLCNCRIGVETGCRPDCSQPANPLRKHFPLQNLSIAFGCYLFHVCKFNWDFIFRLIPLPTEALRKSTLRCVCYSIVSPRAVTKGLPGGKLVHN